MANSTLKTNKFKAKLVATFGTQYVLQSEYNSVKEKIKLLDTFDNTIIEVTPETLFKRKSSHKNVATVDILDSCMGSGKSTHISHMINNKSSEKFIIVLPLLSECHRFAQTVPDGTKASKPLINAFGQQVVAVQDNPNAACLIHMNFKHPLSGKGKNGSKLHDLKRLLTNKQNIVCTHSLFNMLPEDMLPLLKDYNLIIDEAIECLEPYDDINLDALSSKDQTWFTINKDNTITFNYQQFGNTNIKFIPQAQEWINLSDSKRLLWSGASTVLKGLNCDVFNFTKSSMLCTYQYNGSLLDFYLKLHDNVSVQVKTLSTNIKPSSFKDKINIVTDKAMNAVGDKDYALTVTRTDKDTLAALSTNLTRFFTKENKTAVKPANRLFTCFKDNKSSFENRYLNQHVAFNTKATNEYSTATHVAFLVDLYLTPELANLNDGLTHKVDKDIYALNHMIQFVFRSAIRKGESINLYIPSKRMRKLFTDWLDDQYVETLPTIN